MRHTLYLLAASTALVACTTTPDAVVTSEATETTVADSRQPQIGSFGFDLAGMDRNVDPGDNFYHFANGAVTENAILYGHLLGSILEEVELHVHATDAVLEAGSRGSAQTARLSGLGDGIAPRRLAERALQAALRREVRDTNLCANGEHGALELLDRQGVFVVKV